MQSALIKRYVKGLISPEEFFRGVKERNALDIDFSTFRSIWARIFRPNRPVWKLLQQLKASYRLLLLSNTCPIHFEDELARHSIIKIFDEL